MATFRFSIRPHDLRADGTYNVKKGLSTIGRSVIFLLSILNRRRSSIKEFKSGELRAKYANIEQQYRDSFDKIANRAEYMGVAEVMEFVKLLYWNGKTGSIRPCK